MSTDEVREEENKMSVGKVILIVFCVVVMLAVAAVAFLQFRGIYDFKKLFGDKKSEIVCQLNAIEDINRLFSEYYKAMVDCDQEVLMASVTDPSIYNDMTATMQKALLYVGYEDIDCYTVAGVNPQEYVVYVMCRLDIAGVNSKPLNINSYYVVMTDEGYKIDNGVHTVEVTDFLVEAGSSDSIEKLYQQVVDDTNNLIETDQTFADFYSEINSFY